MNNLFSFIVDFSSKCVDTYDGFIVDSETGLSHLMVKSVYGFDDGANFCNKMGGTLAFGRNIVEHYTMTSYSVEYYYGTALNPSKTDQSLSHKATRGFFKIFLA